MAGPLRVESPGVENKRGRKIKGVGSLLRGLVFGPVASHLIAPPCLATKALPDRLLALSRNYSGWRCHELSAAGRVALTQLFGVAFHPFGLVN